MRSIFRSALVAVSILCASAGAALAVPITFNINNATLSGSTQGTLNGYFTVSSVSAGSTLVAADIFASSGVVGSFNVAGYEYRFGLGSSNNSIVSSSSLPTQYFDLQAANGNILRLSFLNPGLTANGGTLAGASSFDSESGVNRSIVGNPALTVGAVVTAVPEPSSIALLLTALAMLGGLGFLGARKRGAV